MTKQGGIATQQKGLALVPKPVQREPYGMEVREGSTGRVVYVPPARATLHRVWAVADVDAKHDETTVVVGSARSEAAAMKGQPDAKAVPAAELAFYRKYTEALLRRYLRLSMQVGRVPSLMSRDVFRGHVSSYRVRGFEEVVIFCHDVEQRLAKLNSTEQLLIKRVALQQYTRGEAAGMLGMGLSSCSQRYGQAVDRLTKMFLETGLLDMSRL